MASDDQISQISKSLEQLFARLITDGVASFEVLDEKYVPYGLKAHTRSICWLAEQVILQHLKKYEDRYGVHDYQDPISDIAPWDGKFKFKDLDYQDDVFINLKVSDVTKPVRRNDIASVKALLNFFSLNRDAAIFFVVVRLKFVNNKIFFVEPVTVRYYPWIKDFVVNPRNKHLQSIYDVHQQPRTTAEFLSILEAKAEEKGLSFKVPNRNLM